MPTPYRPILHYAAALVILAAVEGVFRYVMRRTMIGVSRKVEYDLAGALSTRTSNGFPFPVSSGSRSATSWPEPPTTSTRSAWSSAPGSCTR